MIKMEITVVVDLQNGSGFTPEFGLSLLLRTASGDYLFDTGAGTALGPNLHELGSGTDSIRQVILSHGHYDHTGGLASLQPEKIWCCPGIRETHCSLHDDQTVHVISMPKKSKSVLQNSEVEWIKEFRQIAPDLFLTGPIPRHSGEDCGGCFFHDENCTIPDDIPEEQSILTPDGLLMTGCCHAGIINTIDHCRKHHPEIAVRAVVGGLHLRNADRSRLEQTAEYFRSIGIAELYLMHCTGDNAVDFLKNALPGCRIFQPRPGETFSPLKNDLQR